MTLCGHCVESLCVCTGQTISLSVLAQKPNKGLELEISRETGSGRGVEGPREDRSQLTKEVGERQLTTVSRESQEKIEAGQRRKSTEVRKATAKT